jgi:hypothetical protein
MRTHRPLKGSQSFICGTRPKGEYRLPIARALPAKALLWPDIVSGGASLWSRTRATVFCMRHQVTLRASLAAIDHTLSPARCQRKRFSAGMKTVWPVLSPNRVNCSLHRGGGL